MTAMKRIDSALEIVLEPAATATAAVIWLHGLGADGSDFVPIVPELGLPSDAGIRFIFPHAAVRPVTLNGGYPMRAWYDIRGLSADAPEDAAGLRAAAQRIDAYIAAQIAAGLPSTRIVLAGFSQGGAVALHCALRQPQPLAGVIALSTYLPRYAQAAAERHAASRALPVLLAHGRFDQIVAFKWGEDTHRELAALGCAVEWKAYPMQHEVCAEELADIAAWLRRRL